MMEFCSIFVIFLILGSNVHVVLSTDCQDMKDCISCVQHRSWLNTCRWCPRDEKCHAFGSLGNPCSKSENIVTKDDCKNILPTYQPNLAYKMVFLSALAYSDVVKNYIPKASEVNTFILVKQVTEPCPGDANCSGFVAVSHTEQAIAVAFRGSEHIKQVIAQILEILTEPKVSFPAGGKVQEYFNDAFLLIWNKLKYDVYQQITNYPSYKLWITGHSLGGAMASLASTALAYERKITKNSLIFYSFGQPRVGDYDYALTHDKLVPISFRVTHYRDIVVHLPTCKNVVCLAIGGGPYHHGKEIFYNKEVMTKSSSYKVCNKKPYNEDITCSNNPIVWAQCFSSKFEDCVKDHKIYFGFSVGTWWHNVNE